jgi:alpha-1,6-mannosyltransferase
MVLYLPFLSFHGRLPVGSFATYLSLWRINGPLYGALQNVLPNIALVPIPAALGFAVAASARQRWLPDDSKTWAWPAAVALLFAPTLFPWYLLWLTPFLFSTSTLPLAVWSVSVLATYSALPGWAVEVIEYGPAETLIIAGHRRSGLLPYTRLKSALSSCRSRANSA